jgi:HK97 family phage prohead protease
MRMQAVSFSRSESPDDVNNGQGWTRDDAAAWCRAHDFKDDVPEAGEEEGARLWARQLDPDECETNSFRTITENFPVGVQGVVCEMPVEEAAPEGEQVGKPPHLARSIMKDGKPQTQHKAAALGIEDEENRIVSFIASDETVDRMGDIIRADGWQLRDFKKNPVLLWAHNSSEPPIGTVTDIRVEKNRLLARAKFMPEGLHDFADKIWKMVQLGFLRAVSVGFMPVEWDMRKGADGEWLGYEFTKQQLLELSVVPVPANPAALTVARKVGLDSNSTSKLFIPTEESIARVRASHSLLRNRLRLARLGVSGNRSITL